MAYAGLQPPTMAGGEFETRIQRPVRQQFREPYGAHQRSLRSNAEIHRDAV